MKIIINENETEVVLFGQPRAITKFTKDDKFGMALKYPDGFEHTALFVSAEERDQIAEQVTRSVENALAGFITLPPEIGEADTEDDWSRLMIARKPAIVKVGKTTEENPSWFINIDGVMRTFTDEQLFANTYSQLVSYIAS